MDACTNDHEGARRPGDKMNMFLWSIGFWVVFNVSVGVSMYLLVCLFFFCIPIVVWVLKDQARTVNKLLEIR